MKLKNKFYVWTLLAMSAAAMTACSDKDEPGGGGSADNGDGVELAIKTSVKLNTKAALIEDLTDGHEMNLQIEVNDENGSPLKNVMTKAVNKGGVWSIENNVRLAKGQTAEVQAIYPYVDGVEDITKYPIDVTKQVDVLYSGKGSFASSTSNTASLNMKHALSLLSVNITKSGYSGEGLLTAIKVEQPSLIATKGTLNGSTGKIASTEFGTVSGQVNATLTDDGISGALPGLWVIPFSSKDKDPVKITLTIDGKDYTVELPEITMNIGWQYAFKGVLSANGLVFIPDATEEYELNQKDEEFVDLNNYGMIKLTFKGSEFHFPIFEGESVFGNIAAQDGSVANYSIGGSLKLKNTDTQTITVETWNSTGFEISSFEGIDEIDLSQY